MGARGAGGIGLVGTLVVLAVGYFFGVDISPLVGGASDGMVQGQPRELSERDKEWGQFLSVVLADTEEVWGRVLPEQAGVPYRDPTLVLFSGTVQSACGGASAAMGPFYCPGDQKLYLDTDFFDIMANRMGASGDFAAAYVVAHEVGHHVQNLIGVLPEVSRARAQAAERDSNYLSVLTELQADCFAGIWARQASDQFGTISQQDLNEAMNAAAAVGDDVIQQGAGRVAVPDSFTHGSAADRQEWLARGFKAGTLDACNTFREAGL